MSRWKAALPALAVGPATYFITVAVLFAVQYFERRQRAAF